MNTTRIALLISGTVALLCSVRSDSLTAQSADDVVLYTADAGADAIHGRWTRVPDPTAAAGAYLRVDDTGTPAPDHPAAQPADYFELQFQAVAGTPYQVWMRGRAQNGSYMNDSAWVQFSSSVDAGGRPVFRIGTTDAMKLVLQEYTGAPISNWGWHDNGWGPGVRGTPVFFDHSGLQLLRVQIRQDGLGIDQILLSPNDKTIPGASVDDATILNKAVATTARAADPASVGTPAATARPIRMVQWNIHKAREECPDEHGQCLSTIDRIVSYLSSSGADVVSLNEVEYQNPTYQLEDQPAALEAALEAQTSQCWNHLFVPADFATGAANGIGNLLLWRCDFAIQSSDRHALPPASDGNRAAAAATLLVGNRPLTFITTHVCAPGACTGPERQAQIEDLKLWAGGKTSPRVIAGDFNAEPGSAEIGAMTVAYDDLRVRACAGGVATPANCSEGTHGGDRFDYIFLSREASGVTLINSTISPQVRGTLYAVSDHRPVQATLMIQ